MGYEGIKLHPVAGKCGVFAETDINGLQKMGVPPDELMASLFEAIVMQNLSVLTRGNTLRPVRAAARRPEPLHQGHARLLEGTTSRRSGRSAIPPLPEGVRPEGPHQDVPDNAQYFAAHRRGRVRQDRGRGRRRRTAASTSSSGTSMSAATKRRRSAAARRAGEGRGRARGVQGESTAPRSSPRRRSSRATWSKASSASTAAPPPPRPCCCRRTTSARSSPRPTSSRRAIPIEDTSRDLRTSSSSRSATRARR